MSMLLETMRRSNARRRARARVRVAPPLYEIAFDDLPIWSDDIRLFALTFIGGFLFMTVYLA